jgi:hypothetical protein
MIVDAVALNMILLKRHFVQMRNLIDSVLNVQKSTTKAKLCKAGHSIKFNVLMRRTDLKCMDQSGCTATFPESEIQRFLQTKTYEALNKIRTRNEIQKVHHQKIPLIKGKSRRSRSMSILRLCSHHGRPNRSNIHMSKRSMRSTQLSILWCQKSSSTIL